MDEPRDKMLVRAPSGSMIVWAFWATVWVSRVIAAYLLAIALCFIFHVTPWIGVAAASALWLVFNAPEQEEPDAG